MAARRASPCPRPPLLALLARLALAGPLFAAPTPAQACKPVPGPPVGVVPRSEATVGPRPLLIAFGEGRLRRLEPDFADGLALEPDPGFPGGDANNTLRGWRPAADLPSGRYAWVDNASERRFFVDSTLATTPPALGEVTVLLTLDEAAPAGCGAGDSCSDLDLTRLELDIANPPSDTAPSTYLLELATPRTGDRVTTLLAAFPDDLGARLLVHAPVPGLPALKRATVCVALTAIGDDATLGPRLDLGCLNPDGADPRVEDTSGCALGDDPLGLGLGLLFLLRVSRPRLRV